MPKFNAFSPLPSSYSLNINNLDEFGINGEFNILPYIENDFLDNDKYSYSIHSIGTVVSWKANIFDGSEFVSQASTYSSCLEYDKEVYAEFLDRFIDLFEQKLKYMVSSYQAGLEYNRADNLTDILLQLANKMKDLFTLNEYTNQNICNPVYIINSNEHDLIYHMDCILRFLRHPFYLGKFHGLVVICRCRTLMIPLYILSWIINESQPAKNLYTFIPQPSIKLSTPLSKCNTAIIFQCSDIESASQYCISAFKNCYLSFVLVEEAIHDCFTERIKSILEKNVSENELYAVGTSSPQFEIIKSQINKITKYGASLVSHSNGTLFSTPIVLDNVVPSLLDSYVTDTPIGYIIPFRSPKEAITMISHFIKQARNSNYEVLADKLSDFSANLWVSNASITWQLFGLLSDTGVDNIFLNAPYIQFMSTLSLKNFESYINKHSCARLELHKRDIHISKQLVEQVLAADKVQTIWIGKGFDRIHIELLGLKHLFDHSVLKMARSCFVNYSKTRLYEASNFDAVQNKDNPNVLPLVRSFLKPVGPVLLLLYPECFHVNMTHNVLVLLLSILYAGNSVLLMVDKENDLFIKNSIFSKIINSIQQQLGIKDLITWHMFDCISKSESNLSVYNLPGFVFDSNLANALREPSETNMLCLSKTVKLYCSSGCNLFH